MPGGGVTYLELAEWLKVDRDDPRVTGRVLLANALYKPFEQLMENAGLESQTLLLLNHREQLKKAKKPYQGVGIDLNQPGRFVQMKANGIVDPSRVVKEAIQNAVSVAGTAMTMGALVNEVPEKNPPAAAPDMGAGMMGM